MSDDAQFEQRRRLAAAARLVIERLVSTPAPAEELAAAADRLEQFAETLAHYPANRSYEGFSEAALVSDLAAFIDDSPISGKSNPIAAPLEIELDGDVVRGRATFGVAYEGPPGCLHGGFIAAIYDEALGMAQALSGKAGMTGTLEVVYRRPTPLYRELRLEARLDRVEGRKVYTSGRLWAGDVLCSEATGIFITVDQERFEQLLESRERDRR